MFDRARSPRHEALAPLLTPERGREVLRVASMSPDDAASIEEMAVIKRGSFGPAVTGGATSARILIWNVERGRAPARWAEMEAVRAADVLLLCEVDDGMARSGNLDVAAELAERLGLPYAFTPNYFELTRGTRRERIRTRGVANLRGLHGNAILSRWPLGDVRRVQLPVQFDWFRHYERRIGTRVALRATLDGPSAPFTVAVAHLEAFATPAQRARQMQVLVAALADAPRVLLGGDFNTLGIRPGWDAALSLLGERARDPHRLTRSVIAREPLFEEARRAGFSWEDVNAVEPTWCWSRRLPTSFGAKLDWAFGRGMVVEPGSVAVVPARPQVRGPALSDHDGLALTIRL